jgi:uncharacterized integral membrane protein
MRVLRRLLALVVFVAALVIGWRFAAVNLEPVRIDYLLGVREAVPLWGALVGAFGLGFALAGVVGLYQMARLSLLARRWRKVAQGLEGELHELRNLPLASPSERGARGSAGTAPPATPLPGALDPSRGR